MTQPGAQLSGMFHMGITVLHHPAVGPHVADVLPAPAPQTSGFTVALRMHLPSIRSGGRHRDPALGSVVRNGWYGLCGAASPRGGAMRQTRSPQPPHKEIGFTDCCDDGVLAAHCPSRCPPPTHHSGGDAVAARGEMCVCGATNLVGEATGASLAGGSMLECCGFTASCRSDRRMQRCERSGPCRPHSFCLALEQPRRSVGGRKGNVSSPLHCRGQWWAMQPPSP